MQSNDSPLTPVPVNYRNWQSFGSFDPRSFGRTR